MTPPRLVRPALVLIPALVLAGLAVPTSAPAAPAPAAPAIAAAAESRAWDDTYYSTPPSLTATAAPARAERAKPKPPPTSGFVTGRVIGPGGKPVKQALVYGVRFSDLGLPVDFSEEARVLTRTKPNGFFRLPQLTERYLVRICAAEPGGEECSPDPTVKSFAPSYVGPDGTTVSWLRQTSMFLPRKPSRSIGEVTVKASAALAGTFRGGPNQAVYLLRGDNSIADRAFTDEKGKYRFEVAGGTYRVEADRDPGLRTDDTVPGFRSDKLKLKPGRITHLSFRTRHAGVVRGTVTSGGSPVADVFLAILDKGGDFAAGVVTDADGRYAVTSLKPGTYTIRTSVAFSDYVAAAKPVTLEQTTAKTVDIALDPGATIRFSALDVGGNGAIAAELRNQAGRVMKVFEGDPTEAPGGQVVFRGLPPEQYKLYVRRAAFPFASPTATNFPWAQKPVSIAPDVEEVNLGPIPLDQASVDLTGRLNKGTQVKITALPQDPWLREAHEFGDAVTPMALVWTEIATRQSTYTAHGMVPGTYNVLQTTSYRERGNKPTANGANRATTQHSLTVSGSSPTASFNAPKGAMVKGRMRYASNGLPVIAPVGFRVYDSGAPSWLFPTVSEKQRFGKPFRVERLHKGDAVGRILDLEGLYEEHPDTLIPDSLLASARIAELGTPYWLTTKAKRFTLKRGQVLDLGELKVLLRGLDASR